MIMAPKADQLTASSMHDVRVPIWKPSWLLYVIGCSS